MTRKTVPYSFRVSLLRSKKQRVVISGAVQDVNDGDLIVLDSIENQVIAVGAAADSVMLIAWNEGKGAGDVADVACFGLKLAHECAGACLVVGAMNRPISRKSAFAWSERTTFIKPSGRGGLPTPHQAHRIRRRGCEHGPP
jgi:hypothetical protein